MARAKARPMTCLLPRTTERQMRRAVALIAQPAVRTRSTSATATSPFREVVVVLATEMEMSSTVSDSPGRRPFALPSAR